MLCESAFHINNMTNSHTNTIIFRNCFSCHLFNFAESSWTMPFSINELVPMSQALKDACIGIIELAHPDTTPALRNMYRAAFLSVSNDSKISGAMMNIEELQIQRKTLANLFKVLMCCFLKKHSLLITSYTRTVIFLLCIILTLFVYLTILDLLGAR